MQPHGCAKRHGLGGLRGFEVEAEREVTGRNSLSPHEAHRPAVEFGAATAGRPARRCSGFFF